MSYIPGLGASDGPITAPVQVDPTLAEESIVVGTVTPVRVSCDQLPADSPWRKPGQACATPGSGLVDSLKLLWDKITTPSGDPTTPATTTTAPATPVPPPPAADESPVPRLLMFAAVGALGYYLLKKRKRR